MVKNKESNNILFLFLLLAGLFSTCASVSYSHLQLAQTVYGTIDSGYAAAAVGDTGIGGTSETSSTLDDLPPISATFNEPMDGTTLNSSTFTVRDSNGDNISGTVSLGSDNKTATFTPLSPLAYSSEYIATINTGAKDLAGNPLPTGTSWSFFATNIDDKQSEDILDVSYYDTPDNNITSSEDVLTNSTEGASFYSYPDPKQQGQQQQLINDNVSSSRSSFLPVAGQTGTTVIESSLQPSAALISSGTANNFTGNLNQSSSTFTPLSNIQHNSITAPEQKGAEAGFPTSQPSDPGTILALQPQQLYQSNLLPYQQYYQYPPPQLYQNKQFSYPSSNLTSGYTPDGVGGIASPLVQETNTLTQPLQQLPPTGVTEPLRFPNIIPPETYLISAVDSNGINVQSGAIVSSEMITITFAGVDDSETVVGYQCSYDGQAPYACASPFVIDNSLALATTNSLAVPNSNSHTLLISALDASGNIDQTPASFIWAVGSVQETAEMSAKPITPTLPSTVPQTEPTALPPELSEQLLPQLAGHTPQALENGNSFSIPNDGINNEIQ